MKIDVHCDYFFRVLIKFQNYLYLYRNGNFNQYHHLR
jgi:hypothetical protein